MPRVRSIQRHATETSGPVEIDWASSKQKECFEYGPYPICASGGFGAAKTWAFCLKAIWLSTTFPQNRGVIGRRVHEELKHTTMSSFYKVCPPDLYDPSRGGKRSDSEKYLRFREPYNSEILWMHMDDPETENVIRGIEINWFFLDQAEELREEIFTLLSGRLGRWDMAIVPQDFLEASGGLADWRWKNFTGKPIVPTYPMLACNPDNELHWIYMRFHPDSPDYRKKMTPMLDDEGRPVLDDSGRVRLVSYRELGYKMVQMKSYENKFLPKQNLQQLMLQDESFRRRFVEGEWGIPEGQVHYIDKLSILTTDPADKDDPASGVFVDGYDLLDYFRRFCSLHRTLDHGDASPTCCIWWAADREGNIFAFREYYMPNKMISEHRENLYRMSLLNDDPNNPILESYRSNLADPSIHYKTSQKEGGRWSVLDEYTECRSQREATRIYWQKADNNELGTRNRINEYLRVDPERIHPITKKPGSPRVFFVEASAAYPEGCDHLLRETQAQRRVKLGTENGKPIFSDDRDEKLPDHAYDCLHGDTRILTPEGALPIRLLPESGIVLSVDGWRPYRHCGLISESSPVVKIGFDDGRSVVCTPDHLFLTADGRWVEAAFSAGESCYRVSQCDHRSSAPQFRSFKANATIFAAYISSGTAGGFIGWCGRLITDLFQTVTTFTTRIRTALIITRETSSACPAKGTSATTLTLRRASSTLGKWRSSPPKRRLRSGTGARKGGSGTARTIVSTWRKLTRAMCRGSAIIAGSLLLPRALPQTEPAFALTPARATGAERPGLTVRREAAAFAGKDSPATGLPRPNTVPSAAPSRPGRVLSVRQAGQADTYCLEVPDTHAFAIEGGIIVHNCARYFVASRPPLAVPEKTSPHPNSFNEVARRFDEFQRKGGYNRLAKRIARAQGRRF